MYKNTRVLIVDDESLVAEMIEGLLEEMGYTVVGKAASGSRAVEMTQALRPDVVLMDIKMPDMDGIEATRRLYESCATPVVVLTAYETPELVERASAAGVGAYMVKPPNAREMERAITIAIARFDDMIKLRSMATELVEANKQLEKLSVTDGLTGLYNHRYLVQALESEFARSLRYNRDLALLMLDIDHFKWVNDNYGHPCGDLVLQGIANLLQNQVRNTDIVARYGGEEITIILPELGTSHAVGVAEKLRREIENYSFVCDESPIKITVSIGVVAYKDNHIESWKQLLNSADKALYSAKKQGRNRVVPYSEGLS
ncbi:MAG: diguanylate cyclase [Deltaproteobacteria bacterium]|nr:diguanylate cyclase [Deltaproteobacteria bacterium]MBW2051283.1 diguanylate cyclase [Deltaproteobacteria bacterium]MBW2140442.1 diguanylate cyclase [Deltaproteobacteria bacterium]MBW2323227.1 diguanylate cyclase [Deltaproteobacteria bacterium]